MALFDKTAFNNLIDGDKELFTELLKLFAGDYPRIIELLRAAVTDSDFKATEMQAHRARGMVRNFFAAELAELAGQIEEAGRNGNLKGVAPRIEALAEGLKSLEDELAAHLRSLG